MADDNDNGNEDPSLSQKFMTVKMRLGLSPDEFEGREEEFCTDLANLLGVDRDDVRIESVAEAPKPKP
jgi:hypothetical protein